MVPARFHTTPVPGKVALSTVPSDATATGQEDPESLLPSRARLAALTLPLACVLFVTVGLVVQASNIPFGLWFSEVFILLGVGWVITRFSGRDPVVYAHLTPPGPAPLVTGLLLGAVNYFGLVIPLEGLAQKAAPWLFRLVPWLKDFAPDAGRIFEHLLPVELAGLLAVVSVVAPLCEEVAFRGILQQGLFPGARSPWPAILVAAALFSAFHQDVVGFPARLELGVLFGWLFWRSGSLWAAVAAHSANNVVTTALYLVGGQGERSGDIQQVRSMQLVALGAAGLVVMTALTQLVVRRPSLLRARPSNREVVQLAHRSLYELGWPWLLGGTVSLLLLFAVDHRGVALNWYDLQHPLPAAASRDQGRHPELWKLREQVRAGRAPMASYQDLRSALSAGSP